MNKKGCLFAGLYIVGAFFAVGILGQFLDAHRNQIPGRGAVHNLFASLALISFLGLLLGLIAPKLYSRLLGAKATRKHIAYIFGTSFFAFMLFSGSTLSDAEKATQKKEAAARAAAKVAKREAKEKAKQRGEEARIAAASPTPTKPIENSNTSSSSGDFSDAADAAAKSELQTNAWVRDVYISPGHMNIGVIRGEKDWTAPIITSYACGVLRKHGSTLNWVRFVDIEAVATQGKSPNQAEIYKGTCP